MERIEQYSVVRNTETDELGVTVTDNWGVCSPSETPVIYEGSTASIGTDTTKLVVEGEFSESYGDLDKCGAGKGEYTCRYLGLVGALGPACLRYSSLRYEIESRDNLTAKANPKKIYPACQEEIQAGIAAGSTEVKID